jgi:hypothetical protein
MDSVNQLPVINTPQLTKPENRVRWAVMDEPSADEVINPGPLKCITGNDAFFARDLFQPGKEVAASRLAPPKAVVETKSMYDPYMKYSLCPVKDATWNRARVVPFEQHATWNWNRRVVPFENTCISFEKCSTARRGAATAFSGANRRFAPVGTTKRKASVGKAFGPATKRKAVTYSIDLDSSDDEIPDLVE